MLPVSVEPVGRKEHRSAPESRPRVFACGAEGRPRVHGVQGVMVMLLLVDLALVDRNVRSNRGFGYLSMCSVVNGQTLGRLEWAGLVQTQKSISPLKKNPSALSLKPLKVDANWQGAQAIQKHLAAHHARASGAVEGLL